MTYYVDRDFTASGYKPGNINPASVDLEIRSYRRLKQTWRKLISRPYKANKLMNKLEDVLGFRPDVFNPDHRNLFWSDNVELKPGDEIELLGNEPILLSTVEKIIIPKNCMGLLFSKSSFGRALQEHLHAGLFDPGFSGVATLEAKNMAPFPVKLRFKQKVVQLIMLRGPEPNKTYQGRYQNQTGAEPIRKEVINA